VLITVVVAEPRDDGISARMCLRATIYINLKHRRLLQLKHINFTFFTSLCSTTVCTIHKSKYSREIERYNLGWTDKAHNSPELTAVLSKVQK